MKSIKTSVFALVVMFAITSLCMPVRAFTSHVNAGDTLGFNAATTDNVFGELLNWNGIVFGDVTNVIDVEGTLAVGGNFISNTGFSANSGAYGQNPASTENVALLVNGNVNIAGYGGVWGQTVISTAEGNTYHLTNTTPSGTTNGQYTVADSTSYFVNAMATAYTATTAIEAVPVNGTYEASYGTYTFAGDPDADILVYNVDDATFNSYLFDFTIAEGQTVIVNLTTSDKITLKYGAFCINGNMDPDYLRSYNRNIIINVVNSTEIEMNSCELHGILLAPATDLTGAGSNVCGTTIVKSITGTRGFELHVGYGTSIPQIPEVTTTVIDDPGEDPEEPAVVLPGNTVIRVDAPRMMAVAFDDGTVYYGGEMMEVEFDHEYMFQMCAVNWSNGIFDDNGNGIRGTVVYRMTVVHNDDFLRLAEEARLNPDRYTVKGIDIIDNEGKTIIINGDAEDSHLETDVNNFFMAYRFSFEGENYGKKTGIAGVIDNPIESLSVNLPLGTTVTCDAYIDGLHVATDDVFITHNSGTGIYESVYLTSVNDYVWTIA